jgi:long-chain fatty acid transport protein
VRSVAPFVLLLLVAPPVQGTDGHFLHGVGAVNSAMGGSGVAAIGDLLGSFYLNPAGLHAGKGTRTALGFEMFRANRSVSSDIPGFGAGTTQSKTDFVPVPAFAWTTAVNEKVTVGIGGLGIGGFGVDYAQDNTNPVVGPRPQGFGQVYSNFSLMKVSPALAFEASDKLQVGLAVNVDWASLAVDPFPAAAPAFDPGTGSAYYSRATAADGAWGFGFQAGLIFKATDNFNVGLSYASKQSFQDFEYNVVNENPNLANFGQARSITFGMDVPAVYAGGFAFEADKLLWTADAKYITYSKTEGFEKSGFDATGAVQGFGWEDIMVLATGIQFSPNDAFALRGGWNYSENPIPDEQSFFNIPAPAIVQQHATVGLGFVPVSGLHVDLAYYHVFENEISGVMWGPTGPMAGTSATSKMYEDSFLMTFSFYPEG